MKKIFIGLLLITLIQPLYGADVENNLPPENGKNISEQAEELLNNSKKYLQKNSEDLNGNLNTSRDEREKNKYVALLNYSYLDLMIPGKIGITLGKNETSDITHEIELLKGSLSIPFIIKDLGSVTDQRISLIRRSYSGSSSFNVSYGLSYFGFDMIAGNEILSRASSGAVPDMSIMEIKALGFNWALGNRWAYKNNISWGVDWISWSQPIYIISKNSEFSKQTNNQNDINDINSMMNTVSYFPRFSFLKLQFGLQF